LGRAGLADTVDILRLGSSGDGIAETQDGTVYVAYALPGERVAIEREGIRAHPVRIESASPDRVEPFCPYFGRCGGCVAQHIGPSLYGSWKRDTAIAALRQAGLKGQVGPLVDAHGEGRRRITLHVRRRDGVMQAGFMERRRHDLVAIEVCPKAVPALAPAPRIASALGEVLAGTGKPLDVAVTATETGLDVDLRGSGDPGQRRRAALMGLASEFDLARLSLHGEILLERRRPIVKMGPARVSPPAGGFLQATAAGEAALAAGVVQACGGAKRVADLFAGCGPFTLRLAQAAEVHAVEMDRAALAAVDRAARETPGTRRVTTETRDLFRRPLLGSELERFDAVVLDPPRAGAEAQVRQLAMSAVPLVVMVSCDPGTYARDAAILVGAGFEMGETTPVDQFKWGAPLELVGTFRRTLAKKRRTSLRPR
jgi:23S rRNA (uracil1939-C5)-methyltransferase